MSCNIKLKGHSDNIFVSLIYIQKRIIDYLYVFLVFLKVFSNIVGMHEIKDTSPHDNIVR